MEENIWLNKKVGLFFLILIATAVATEIFKPRPVIQISKPAKQEKPLIVEIEVREGWCLSKIAQDLGTDWQEIAKLNSLKNPNLIYPGQKLKVIPFDRTNIVKVSFYGEEFHGESMADGKKNTV